MDIQAEKIALTQLLLQTEDVAIIKKVKAIFNSQKADFWEELTNEQKEFLEASLKQADEGDVHDFKEFIEPYL